MWQFIAAAAMQVGSGLSKARQEKEALEYQEAEARRQKLNMLREAEVEDQIASVYSGMAAIERGKGQVAKNKAEAEAYVYGDQTKKLLGKNVAKSARGGIRVGTGSALDTYANLAADRAYTKSVLSWQGDAALWAAEGEAWEKEIMGKIHLDKAKVLRADAGMKDVQAGIYDEAQDWTFINGLMGGGGDALSTLSKSGMFDSKASAGGKT